MILKYQYFRLSQAVLWNFVFASTFAFKKIQTSSKKSQFQIFSRQKQIKIQFYTEFQKYRLKTNFQSLKPRKIMPNNWNWFFCSILFSKICPKHCSSIKAIFSGSLVRPRKMRASRHLSQYEIRASSVISWLSSPLKIAKATKTDSIWSKGRPNIGLKRRKWSNDKMAGKFCIFSVNPHVFTLLKQNKQILTSFCNFTDIYFYQDDDTDDTEGSEFSKAIFLCSEMSNFYLVLLQLIVIRIQSPTQMICYRP